MLVIFCVIVIPYLQEFTLVYVKRHVLRSFFFHNDIDTLSCLRTRFSLREISITHSGGMGFGQQRLIWFVFRPRGLV